MLFLRNHPGWSWRDLQEAPVEVIDLLRRLDAKIAEQESRP